MTKWKNVPKDIEPYKGFVYKITNLKTGQYYIGKKFYWSVRTLKPLKGTKRRRKVTKESDWKNYWGSSNNLQKDLDKYGHHNFKREVVTNCDSKFECAYRELLLQLEYDVLHDPLAYNEIINVRLRKQKK